MFFLFPRDFGDPLGHERIAVLAHVRVVDEDALVSIVGTREIMEPFGFWIRGDDLPDVGVDAPLVI